jgi:hypothetical protein
MNGVHGVKTASCNIGQIKGIDTKPELLVRKYLFFNGFRYFGFKLNTPQKYLPFLKWHLNIVLGGLKKSFYYYSN